MYVSTLRSRDPSLNPRQCPLYISHPITVQYYLNHINHFILFAAGMEAKFRAHEEFGDRRENVIAARTYFYEDEEACEENMQSFLNGIDAVSGTVQTPVTLTIFPGLPVGRDTMEVFTV